MNDFARALETEIQAIRRRLSDLMGIRGATTFTRKPPRSAATSKSAQRRKMKITPERREQMQLQGQFMSGLRRLSATQRKAVQRLREAKGMKAAVREAKRIARGPARKRPAARKTAKRNPTKKAKARKLGTPVPVVRQAEATY